MPDYVANNHVVPLIIVLGSIQCIAVFLGVSGHCFVDRHPEKFEWDIQHTIAHLPHSFDVMEDS
jgi:hypothetical protein